MKPSARTALIAVALVALTAARQGDVKEYDGSEITSEDGIVVMRAIWERSQSSGGMKALSRDDQTLYGLFKEAAGGKRKVIVEDIDKIRAFVMPAGRWYLAEIRTPRERNLPPIAKSLQSFEVRGDHINFGGVYTITMSTDPDGNQVANTSVDYGPALVEEAAAQWPEVFGKKTLLYCPIGKKCKLPSEFKF
jgi:hypothetical protein